MADVFAVLKADHGEVQQMLTQLEAGQGDTSSLAEKLVIEESKHEAAEEMYFWPSVREKVSGGDGLADQAISQENEGKKVLESLRKAEPGTSEFARLIAEFAEAGRPHIAFEENQVWSALRAALTAEELEQLGGKVEMAKRTGPTRPHPGGPDSPGGLKAVGTAAAMADKVTDAVTGRGSS